MGSKLYSVFEQAGLPAPVMRLEAIVGGPGDPSGVVRDLLDTIFPTSVAPMLEQHGIANAADIDAKTLPDRMAAELADLGSVVIGRSRSWSMDTAAVVRHGFLSRREDISTDLPPPANSIGGRSGTHSDCLL